MKHICPVCHNECISHKDFDLDMRWQCMRHYYFYKTGRFLINIDTQSGFIQYYWTLEEKSEIRMFTTRDEGTLFVDTKSQLLHTSTTYLDPEKAYELLMRFVNMKAFI